MHEIVGNCNLDCENGVMDDPWRFQTNWIISHGSLDSSVTVESSNCPNFYDDTENPDGKSPLVLKPQLDNSNHCEITMCCGKKFDVGLVYVRSTARVYEIYYASSPQSFNEYLCTVRCSVAERDETILQTTDIEYESREPVDCRLGEIPEDIVRGNSVSSDDDWVKIKIPRVGCSSSRDDNGEKVLQNLYEATAQISDADLCSSLTIRFLSLQNRCHVYVDEVYVLANPTDIVDSGEDSMTSKMTTGNSLMAMLVPALLQSTRSGLSRVNETHASGGVPKVDNMENVFGTISENGGGSSKNPTDEQCAELLDTPLSDELGQPIPSPLSERSVEFVEKNDVACVRSSQVPQESVKLQELGNNAAEFNESQQPVVAAGVEHVLSTLEHLITRVSRVEDICLRFEEKLLKPIESMESRLQKIEHQLEKFAKNSYFTDFPGCARISAPFCCSESNSSSFYIDRSNPPNEPTDFESNKRTSSDNTSNFMPDIKYYPSLVVNAPEFSLDDDDEDNNDLSPVKDISFVKPKLTLSVDEALAAAFSGFVSSTKSDSCVRVQQISDSSTVIDEIISPCDVDESCKMKFRGFLAAENDKIVSTQFIQILSIQAPEFTLEDTGDEEHLEHILSSSVVPSVVTNNERDNGSEMIASGIHKDISRADSFEFKYENGFRSASNGTLNTVSSIPKELTFELDVGDYSEFSDLNRAGNSIEEDKHSSFDEANLREVCTVNLDNMGITVKQEFELDSGSVPDLPEIYISLKRCLKDDQLNISEAVFPTIVNFEFPILDVEFTSNDCDSTNGSLAALFNGSSESNIEDHSVHDTVVTRNTAQSNDDIMDGNERTEILSSNILLVDVGSPTEDESSNLEGAHSLNYISMPEIIASLI